MDLPDFEDLLGENLFVEWAGILCYENKEIHDDNAASFLWTCAKSHALGIADSKQPALAFKNRVSQIHNMFYDHFNLEVFIPSDKIDYATNIVIACVYTMIFYSASENVVEQLAANIKLVNFVPYLDIRRLVDRITEKISKGEIERNYDYTKKPEEIVDDDISEGDKDIESLTALLAEKDQEIAQLRTQLEIYESAPISVNPHDKVRLELIRKLFQNEGADLKTYGNKSKAARLAEFITGLPFQTCKNYMTNHDLNTTKHSKEVLDVNSKLKELGLDWQL